MRGAAGEAMTPCPLGQCDGSGVCKVLLYMPSSVSPDGLVARDLPCACLAARVAGLEGLMACGYRDAKGRRCEFTRGDHNGYLVVEIGHDWVHPLTGERADARSAGVASTTSTAGANPASPITAPGEEGAHDKRVFAAALRLLHSAVDELKYFGADPCNSTVYRIEAWLKHIEARAARAGEGE